MSNRLVPVLIGTALLVAASTASSQSFPPLTRSPVLDETLPPSFGAAKLLKGARIRFAPGQPTGIHRHPIPVVGVVTAGSFVVEVEGRGAKTVRTGEPFFEPAGTRIIRFDNASTSEPAEIVAFYMVDQPDAPLIEMLDGKR